MIRITIVDQIENMKVKGAFLTSETKRSTFVTVLAWIGIVFTGFGTFISAVEGIMFHFIFPKIPMDQILNENNSSVQLPAISKFMFTHYDLFFVSMFLLSLFALIASIALLKRKNWARIIYIVLLALGIVWNMVSLVFQSMMKQQVPIPPDTPEAFRSQMQTMMTVMSVVSIVILVLLTVLYGWMLWKLRSPQIVREFKFDVHPND